VLLIALGTQTRNASWISGTWAIAHTTPSCCDKTRVFCSLAWPVRFVIKYRFLYFSIFNSAFILRALWCIIITLGKFCQYVLVPTMSPLWRIYLRIENLCIYFLAILNIESYKITMLAHIDNFIQMVHPPIQIGRIEAIACARHPGPVLSRFFFSITRRSMIILHHQRKDPGFWKASSIPIPCGTAVFFGRWY